jgi:hypothetical protein
VAGGGDAIERRGIGKGVGNGRVGAAGDAGDQRRTEAAASSVRTTSSRPGPRAALAVTQRRLRAPPPVSLTWSSGVP